MGIPAATIASARVPLSPMLAFEASPHFIGTPRITKNSNFSLTVSFKVVGLANVISKVFLTSSDVRGNLQCVRPGGNNPPPKGYNFGPLTGPSVNIQPRNGQITATATMGPPPLPSPSDFCRGGSNTNWTMNYEELRNRALARLPP